MRFKVGDKIKAINSVGVASIGATATVTSVDDMFTYIVWDRDTLSGTQKDGGYLHGSFELIPVFDALELINSLTESQVEDLSRVLRNLIIIDYFNSL